MKLLHPLVLKKTNRIELYIGFVLIVIGILLLKNTVDYEYELSKDINTILEQISKNRFAKYDFIHSLWAIVLSFGIVLFLDSFDMIPEFTYRGMYRRLKKHIKKGIREYKEWRN